MYHLLCHPLNRLAAPRNSQVIDLAPLQVFSLQAHQLHNRLLSPRCIPRRDRRHNHRCNHLVYRQCSQQYNRASSQVASRRYDQQCNLQVTRLSIRLLSPRCNHQNNQYGTLHPSHRPNPVYSLRQGHPVYLALSRRFSRRFNHRVNHLVNHHGNHRDNHRYNQRLSRLRLHQANRPSHHQVSRQDSRRRLQLVSHQLYRRGNLLDSLQCNLCARHRDNQQVYHPHSHRHVHPINHPFNPLCDQRLNRQTSHSVDHLLNPLYSLQYCQHHILRFNRRDSLLFIHRINQRVNRLGGHRVNPLVCLRCSPVPCLHGNHRPNPLHSLSWHLLRSHLLYQLCNLRHHRRAAHLSNHRVNLLCIHPFSRRANPLLDRLLFPLNSLPIGLVQNHRCNLRCSHRGFQLDSHR